MELHTYYGLASANGLESFFRDETDDVNTSTPLGRDLGDLIYGKEGNQEMTQEIRATISGMDMAAQANAHRRSVAFRVRVTPELAEEIEELIHDDPEEALLLLKASANEVAIVGSPSMSISKKFWEQIPNPILDPYN